MRRRNTPGNNAKILLIAVVFTQLMTLSGCEMPIPVSTEITNTEEKEEGLLPERQSEQKTEETEQAVSESAGNYAYQTLNSEEQAVYDEIYTAMQKQMEKVAVDTLDTAVLDHAFRAVSADYGGMFWVSGYVYTQYTKGEKLVGLDFAPKYTMSFQMRCEKQREIDEAVREILAGISPDASDYEKAKYVYDYLAMHVDYEINAADNQNIISVFLNRKTVCQGYANATQYLLDCLSIQSAVVTGTADGEPHAWNLVLLDGEYYMMDSTWGNSTYDSGQQGVKKFVNYNYFAVTTEEISRTHTADEEIRLPECTATADNYYQREGKYVSEWNPQAIGEIYKQGYDTGAGTASVKFATQELYQQAKSYFIDEQHITDYCNGITALSYLEDTNQNVLILNY